MHIVVGASRGIGYALVQDLIGQGQDVVALSRNTSSLKEIDSPYLTVYSLDLGDETAIADFFKVALDWSKLRSVVYCAGLLLNKPFTSISRSDWRRIYDTNVFGPSEFCQGVITKTGLDQEVRHLFIGSMGGFQGSAKFPGLSAYSSSKAAVSCVSECLAEEYKESSHSFNTLSIGAVQTEMLEEAFPGYEAPVSPAEMARFISELIGLQKILFNGKNIPVSLSTP